jgi:hypothetical protein
MPGGGDVTRILGHAGCFWQNVSVAFFPQNHGKYHVGIDLHHADGQALIRKLAARCDVLVENFKPGTTEAKWGLGYRQLREVNPRLIYVSNTGFGQWGPFAEGRASYDGLAQAVSGLTAISGFEGALPTKVGNYLGDWFGACLAAMGTSSRWRSARGWCAPWTGRGSTPGSPGGTGPRRATGTRSTRPRASTAAGTATWRSSPGPMPSGAAWPRRWGGPSWPRLRTGRGRARTKWTG